MQKIAAAGPFSTADEVKAAVEENPACLRFSPPSLRADPQIVAAAVRHKGTELEFAAPELRSLRKLVWLAVGQDGKALRFASPELRKDRNLALHAIQSDGAAMQFADPVLLADERFVLDAVARDAQALQFAARSLRADPEFVREAFAETARAQNFAPRGFVPGEPPERALRVATTVRFSPFQPWQSGYAPPEDLRSPPHRGGVALKEAEVEGPPTASPRKNIEAMKRRQWLRDESARMEEKVWLCGQAAYATRPSSDRR